MPVTVVNMIPKSLSGETNQDSEPNLAVNPINPKQIVGTAFTPNPAGGSFAPIFGCRQAGPDVCGQQRSSGRHEASPYRSINECRDGASSCRVFGSRH